MRGSTSAGCRVFDSVGRADAGHAAAALGTHSTAAGFTGLRHARFEHRLGRVAPIAHQRLWNRARRHHEAEALVEARAVHALPGCEACAARDDARALEHMIGGDLAAEVAEA